MIEPLFVIGSLSAIEPLFEIGSLFRVIVQGHCSGSLLEKKKKCPHIQTNNISSLIQYLLFRTGE